MSRRGLVSWLVLSLALALGAPVMAFLPTDGAVDAWRHPVAEAGMPLALAQKVAHKAASATVILDEEGTRVQALVGKLAPAARGSAEELARAYVQDRFSGLAFRLVRSQDSGAESHVRFVQQVGGADVFGGDLAVHVAKNGSVTMLNGSVLGSDAAFVNSAKLAAGDIAQRALKALGAGRITAPTRAVYPAAEGLRHAWKLDVRTPRSDWLTVLDAETGEVLMAADARQSVDGKGAIYKLDPTHGAPTVETFTHLDGTGNLKGEFADVTNEDTERAQAADQSFVYEPDNTHFDEANVYYHINIIHDHFASLGYKGLPQPMAAVVHVGDGYDNAYFSPWEGTLNFGDGTRLNDLSKDYSVIYHEYTHAVTGDIVNLVYSGESGGLNEGYSDYFAGTMSGDPAVGRYSAARLPNGWIRNMDNKLHYPEDSGTEPHKAGALWGGAIWDVRKALGAEVADKLIHQSRYYLAGSRSTFAAGYQGILKADKTLFAGKNAEAITKVFQARGIAKAETAVTVRDLDRMLQFEAMNRR